MDSSHHRVVTLPDGRQMLVRRVCAADLDGLAQLYDDLSPDDLRRRFFSVYHPPADVLARIACGEDGRVGLVAVVSNGAERLVAEAHFVPLPNGDAEFAITVAPDWRGWLGPYLLDALVETAAELGIPNLEAEILLENRPMLAIVRARGYATLDHGEYSVVRVTIGATSATPSWPATGDRPRVLVEAPGGRWRGETEARREGFEVVVCPGPARGSRTHCPLLAGEPCPLAAGADAVVYALRADDPRSREVLDGLRELHPGLPVCVQLPTAGADTAAALPSTGGDVISRDTPVAEVVAVLQRLTEAGRARRV